MKTIISITVWAALLTSSIGAFALPDSQGTANATNQSTEKATTIASSPDFRALLETWATQYNKLYPNAAITLSTNPQEAAISINNEITNNNDAWKVVIAHNAIVPIANANNPLINELCSKGLSANAVNEILSSTAAPTWSILLNGTSNAPLSIYVANSNEVKNSIITFAKNENSAPQWTETSFNELAMAIKKDVYAIGFCRLTDIRDANTNAVAQGFRIIPIDKNGNGNIDAFENIYQDLKSFNRGVWIGKYPSSLSGNVYATAAETPTNESTLGFIHWVISEGQLYLSPNGYCELSSRERQAVLSSITPVAAELSPVETQTASNRWIVYLLSTLVIAVAIWVFARNKKRKAATQNAALHASPVIDENAICAPKGLYFDKTHTWAIMEPDGNVRVGIDDFLQHVTGSITRVILRENGEEVRRGEKILTLIRNGKQLNIYAPISGTIKTHNPAIASSSTYINNAPYTKGWVYMIEPKNWLREIQFLFLGDRYKEWIKDEFTRLKDFFATSIIATPNAQVVYQDGGEIIDNVLADLEPEVWEEFQSKFIDPSR